MKMKRHAALLVKKSLLTTFLATVILLAIGLCPAASTTLAASQIPSDAQTYNGNKYYIYLNQ